VEEALEGRLEQARSTSTEIDQEWQPNFQAILGGFLAREEMRTLLSRKVEVLENGSSEPLEEALDLLARAWQDALDLEQKPLFIACDVGGVLETLALNHFHSGDTATAIDALRRAERFVSSSPMTEDLFPKALHAEGLAHFEEKRAESATVLLEEARERWLGPATGDLGALKRQLTEAWLLRAHQEVEMERFDAAIESAERANLHAGGSRRTLEAIAATRLARADDALAHGLWSTAQSDLRAVSEGGHLRAQAAMRSRHVRESITLVNRLKRVGRWAADPEVDGMVPWDSEDDGIADFLVLYRRGRRAGSLDLRQPDEVVLTHAPAHEEIAFLIADRDGDGEFDEHVEYQGAGSGISTLDTNGDFLADLRLIYQNDRLVAEKPLSGDVLLRLGSVVIGDRQWDPPWAGAPDPFLVVSKNEERLLRTATIRNTFFPVYSQAVVIHYRFGDTVRVDVIDDDWLYDDWIDAYVFTSLPTSGVFTTYYGRAALEFSVTPSELPDGYTVDFERRYPDENLFRDPHLALPEVADLVASAHELVVLALMPEAPLLRQMAMGIAFDAVILEPMLATPSATP